MIYLRQSTASQEIPLGYFVDSTDGNTEETGLTIANTDIKLWKSGATTLASKTSGGATHISNGIYYAVLDATDTDTVGPMAIFCHVSGALTVRLETTVLEEAMYDWMFGTAVPLSPTTAGRTLDVTATGAAGIDWANVENPTTTVGLSGTTVKTATDVETDTAVIGAAGAGLTAVPWNAAWDAEVQSEVADALTAYGVSTEALLTTVAGYLDTEIAAIKAKTDNLPASPAAVGDIPTSAANADAVWDEVLSGHLGVGSTGEALNAAGAAGDPWTTALPGAYGAGSAGKIIGDNINATISSRASQTSVDTVDGIVDSILVDTAEIGAAGAGLTAADDATLAAIAALNDLSAAGVRTAVGMASADLDTQLAALPTAIENADALLDRNMATGADSGGRTVRNALRFLRNKWSNGAGTLTVYKEDDTTSAWTATTTTSASDPVSTVDPA